MNKELPTNTLVLVDGSNYVYRAYYAIPGLSNSQGFPTNAIYGFTNMLLKIIRQWKPTYLAVVFDLKGPTVRHEIFPDYKATRRATPEDLLLQIPRIKEVIRGLSLTIIEHEGIEADDIIGTIAWRQAAKGLPVVIASGDKDMMQLVTPQITMIDSLQDKIYDPAAVKERFGVEPQKVPDILGLVGDTSDNIPGVPGIGPKTALRLIEEFGSIDALIGNVEKIKNLSQRKLISEYAAQARLSRDLAIINKEIDLDFKLESCRLGEPDRDTLTRLFKEFEFTALLHDFMAWEKSIEGNYLCIEDSDDFAALRKRVEETGAMALEIVADGAPSQGSLYGLALCPEPGQAFYLSLDANNLFDASSCADHTLGQLAGIIGDEKIKKYGHDLKTCAVFFLRAGMNPAGFIFDSLIASYLLNPTRRNFELGELARDHLGQKVLSRRELLGEGARASSFANMGEKERRDFACGRADAVIKLTPKMTAMLREGNLERLFEQMEIPLLTVLAEMETRGVLLDGAALKKYSQELQQAMEAKEKEIYELAGERFNINSPKQLQVILFDKLKLAKGRKIKIGYSTNNEILSELAQWHPLPAEILRWRSMAKLKSTYLDALPELINPQSGRIHTTYNQTITATGRLSSSNPNLQNIPIRTEEGRRIRQAFVAPPGWFLVSADYSQIELRVLAHLSQDQALIESFALDEDIHTRTAADIFNVFPELVTPEMRRQAKVINFGILYGMGAFSLAKELGVSQKMAQAYIDGYFVKYPGVKNYLDTVLSQARQRGYVTTLFNRIRYVPEILSSNANIRQFAERAALNTPIQGTAADLIKLAMVHIAAELRRFRMQARMIMQVHDELVFEVPEGEKDYLISLVKAGMEKVASLSVPLKVEVGSGKNWDEAHS